MTAQLLKIETAPDLVDQVYRSLLDAISDGSLRARRSASRRKSMAEQLAVSRQPVLQALRLLKKDGFVLDAPGRGAAGRAAGPGAGSPRSTRCAARSTRWPRGWRRSARIRIDPALIRARPRGRARRRHQGHDRRRPGRFTARSTRPRGNPLIDQSAQLHWHHIRRAMGAVLQVSTMRESVWDEHEAIAQAVADGDAARAEALMRRHSGQASAYLEARMTEAAVPTDNSVVR